jgi:hypothetical protein
MRLIAALFLLWTIASPPLPAHAAEDNGSDGGAKAAAPSAAKFAFRFSIVNSAGEPLGLVSVAATLRYLADAPAAERVLPGIVERRLIDELLIAMTQFYYLRPDAPPTEEAICGYVMPRVKSRLEAAPVASLDFLMAETRAPGEPPTRKSAPFALSCAY